MLVSSNLAIFGDATHPAVSLHLHKDGSVHAFISRVLYDGIELNSSSSFYACIVARFGVIRSCSNPINVLTGMDYWLDNLMCNVPEVVMWYGRVGYGMVWYGMLLQ